MNRQPSKTDIPVCQNDKSATSIEIARADLRERGVPEELLDLEYNQDFAFDQARYHLQQGTEHLVKAGGWFAYIHAYVGEENFRALCEIEKLDIRMVQVSYCLHKESLKQLSGPGGKRRRPRLGGGACR